MSDSPQRSADPLLTALQRYVIALHREREARKPPVLTGDGTVVRYAACDPCPFDHRLLARRIGFTGLPLTEDEAVRCRTARAHVPATITQTVTVPCSPVTLSADVWPCYRVLAHTHVGLWIAGHAVHLEMVRQELAGPGGTNLEHRIFVNSVLEGRGFNLGRLGGNTNAFPAVARLDSRLWISVEPVHWDDVGEVIVELRT